MILEFVVTNIFEAYGWKLEDSIQFCGTNNSDSQKFDEFSLRAFKDGENLIR